MDLSLSDEQAMLRDTLSRYLAQMALALDDEEDRPVATATGSFTVER